jgi:hypothetical protein
VDEHGIQDQCQLVPVDVQGALHKLFQVAENLFPNQTPSQCCGSGSGAFLPTGSGIRVAFIPDPTYFCIKAINKIY